MDAVRSVCSLRHPSGQQDPRVPRQVSYAAGAAHIGKAASRPPRSMRDTRCDFWNSFDDRPSSGVHHRLRAAEGPRGPSRGVVACSIIAANEHTRGGPSGRAIIMRFLPRTHTEYAWGGKTADVLDGLHTVCAGRKQAPAAPRQPQRQGVAWLGGFPGAGSARGWCDLRPPGSSSRYPILSWSSKRA